MNIEIKIDCEKCGIEDITLDMRIKAKITPSLKEISAKGKEQGWHIGRNCYCPECNQEITARCNTCENYEGNKSMGSSICRKDGKFTTPLDTCKYHKPF
jgi:hypothetical protein